MTLRSVLRYVSVVHRTLYIMCLRVYDSHVIPLCKACDVNNRAVYV